MEFTHPPHQVHPAFAGRPGVPKMRRHKLYPIGPLRDPKKFVQIYVTPDNVLSLDSFTSKVVATAGVGVRIGGRGAAQK